VLSTPSARSSGWLELALGDVRHLGVAVVHDVLDASFIERTRDALYAAQSRIREDVGEERLRRAGELGVLRLMMKYEPHFFSFLELPEVLAVVDATVSETAVLHLQNGFILPSFPPGERPESFQGTFHRDFPRHLEGYLASINVLFAIDAFTDDNGGTVVVSGTHQLADAPDAGYLSARAVPVECPAGSMLVFDSTLWHAAGANTSGKDRLGLNHQFTRSFIKQQIDYVRALGDDVVLAQNERTQQLLGWYTRVVTSLDEYYRPAEERLYRSGQG
jgi:ectoine hydroxylase-related dioxygenase (phytanoyl-CoA dioxygenase family)